MDDSSKIKGELFSRLYIERGTPTQDSATFRTRLVGFLETYEPAKYADIATAIKTEIGVAVETHSTGFGVFHDVPKFFEKGRIQDVLSAITLIWRYLKPKSAHNAWRIFVSRAMREENLGYSLDDACGVHYLVDEEFERNRVSVLRAVDAPRYAAVRAAFESAHSYLDAQPPDTKACVRSMFEAVEILAKLMEPGSQRLNRQLIEKLKVSATWLLGDAIEVTAREKIFDGVADWVDAIHMYRHGQATQEPIAPSMDLAVYVLSSGAAMLRLLLGIDTAPGGGGAPIAPQLGKGG
jgi:hypothetical protein